MFTATAAPQAAHQATLQHVRATHQLACGVVQEDAEYSSEDDHASRGAFDPELCRAVALAVQTSNAPLEVKVTRFLDEQSAREALRAGTLDMIATLSADREHLAPGIVLTQPMFFDALALLVPVAGGAHKPADLRGKRVCVLAETGTEDALRTWFAAHSVDYLPFPFQEEGEMEAAYATGNCEALAGERTRLSLLRLSLGSAAGEHTMLPQPLTADPMAAATRSNDPQWTAVVNAAVSSLLLAEELGLRPSAPTAERLRTLQRRTQPAADQLGLAPDWAATVFRDTGSYADVYERTLGGGSDRKLPRDLNRLQTDGGMLGAP